ncbi:MULTISPECIES: hypothetical protein [Aerosakkonema]|uniref:hypothetical protein n=1 Tax=Aerosakkonema TaxID=1246629 RepID=UPI0035BA5AF0
MARRSPTDRKIDNVRVPAVRYAIDCRPFWEAVREDMLRPKITYVVFFVKSFYWNSALELTHC